MNVIPDDVRHAPFVDSLRRAVDAVGGSLTLLLVDNRPRIAAVVDNEIKFFQIGLMVGEDARDNWGLHDAEILVGKAMVVQIGKAHCGYWENLTGHEVKQET